VSVGWIWQDDIFAIRYPSPRTGKLCPLFLFFGVSGFTRPLNTLNSPLKAFVVRKHGRLPSGAKNKCANAKINSVAERSNKNLVLILSFCPVPDTGTDATVAGFIFGARRSSPFRPLTHKRNLGSGRQAEVSFFRSLRMGLSSSNVLPKPFLNTARTAHRKAPVRYAAPRPPSRGSVGGPQGPFDIGQRDRALPVPHQVF